MGRDTLIEWASHTFNIWWGCYEVSPGCEHCYAKTLANRWGFDVWGLKAPRRFFADKHWNHLRSWNRRARERHVRESVFVGSMCDWAEVHAVAATARQQERARMRLWEEIIACRSLDFLMLTKRPWAMSAVLPPIWRDGVQGNMWLGTSVESQPWMARRLQALVEVRAPVHFVSVEPLLSRVSLDGYYRDQLDGLGRGVNWVVAGGESGPRARPMDEDNVRYLRDECDEHGVPFFYKQKLENRKKISLPMLDGRVHAEVPQ